MLVPRMGEYLIHKGLVSSEGICRRHSIISRKQRQMENDPARAGADRSEADQRADLDQAVTEQIIQLRSALQAANRTLERRVEERTAELQKALERVSELSQLKANFVSNISHELRTPLTHIKGYVELLVTGITGVDHR